MRRDNRKAKIEKRLNSKSWRDCEVLNSKGLHRGTVVKINGVRYMSELYNADFANGIKDEDNKFPSSEPTITLNK